MAQVYLEEIVELKKKRVEERAYNLEDLKNKIKQLSLRPSFYEALARKELSIIGEVKKASPSKGLIKPDFKPLEIAKEYEVSVDAISVLTEEQFFMGKDEYLESISSEIALPTLCKDFIISPIQIYNAKSLGASAVLLIVAILTDQQLRQYQELAHNLGLDALVEVHTADEVVRALSAKAKIIGINNRDLKSFKTDIMTTLKLRPLIPEGILVVSESGIDKVEDIKMLRAAKIDAILVGESFMRTEDIVSHAKEFKNAYKS